MFSTWIKKWWSIMYTAVAMTWILSYSSPCPTGQRITAIIPKVIIYKAKMNYQVSPLRYMIFSITAHPQNQTAWWLQRGTPFLMEWEIVAGKRGSASLVLRWYNIRGTKVQIMNRLRANSNSLTSSFSQTFFLNYMPL